METKNKKLHLKYNVNNSNFTIASNLFIGTGICIILAALIYMIVNLDKADSIIKIWMPFMAAGIFLSFAGTIIRLYHK